MSSAEKITTATQAVATLIRHSTTRLVSDDPWQPRSFTRYCTACHQPWPCPARREALALIERADRLLERSCACGSDAVSMTPTEVVVHDPAGCRIVPVAP